MTGDTDFTGKRVLVVGGSSGIGNGIAHAFRTRGAAVHVWGTRARAEDYDPAEGSDLSGLGYTCVDVADPDAILALATRIRAEHPKLDILMNNAGIFLYKNLTAPSRDLLSLTTEMEVNVNGTIRMTSALIDVITANRGSIINVSSGLAFVPLTAGPIYSATKAAIHSYTISLRFQLQETGVRVIELMPPTVKTDLTADMPEGGDIKVITTDELVAMTIKDLKAGVLEIRPGQSNQLHWMSRIAPGFISEQLYKGSKAIIPKPER